MTLVVSFIGHVPRYGGCVVGVCRVVPAAMGATVNNAHDPCGLCELLWCRHGHGRVMESGGLCFSSPSGWVGVTVFFADMVSPGVLHPFCGVWVPGGGCLWFFLDNHLCAIHGLWVVCWLFVWLGLGFSHLTFSEVFVESLILAQDERWRRA